MVDRRIIGIGGILLGVSAVLMPGLTLAAGAVEAASNTGHRSGCIGRESAGTPGDEEQIPREQWADRFVNAYVPNLIDSPSTDMVDRRHPTLEIGYQSITLGQGSFTNIRSGRQFGVRLDGHARLSRDFQFSLSGPFLKERLELISGPAPDIPGTVSALEFEIKYLVPYEVVGFRTALGGRLGSSKERSHTLFTPDEYRNLASLYAVISTTPTPKIRIHGTAMVANISAPDGFASNSFWHLGVVFEDQLFTFKDSWVRWIVEANSHWFERRAYNDYGDLTRFNEIYFNTGLRAKTGIVHLDTGLRHVTQSGRGEIYFGFTKRF